MWNMYGGLGSLIMRNRNDGDNSVEILVSCKEPEYIMNILKDEPVLAKFFDIMLEESKKIDNIDINNIERELQRKLKLQADRVKQIETLKEELRNTGIDINEFSKRGIYVGVAPDGKYLKPIGKNGEYALQKRYFSLKYNETSLEEEWFKPENRENNPFEEGYNKWLEKMNEENIVDIDKELKKLSKENHKWFRRCMGIFGTELDSKRYDESYAKWKKLNDLKEEGENLKRDKENLDKMTVEQKEKIYEIFKITKECEVTGKEIDLEHQIYLAITKNTSNVTSKVEVDIKRRKWSRVFKNLIEKRGITEDVLDNVDSILSEFGLGYTKYNVPYKVYEKDEDYDEEEISDKYDIEEYRVILGYLEERKDKIVAKSNERKKVACDLLKSKIGSKNNKKVKKVEKVNEKVEIDE